jgi:hypothetical protein
MSDLALLRSRRTFGYATFAAVLVLGASLILGLGELVSTIIVAVAFACVTGWWWFQHSIEVRELAQGFRDRNRQS